MRGGHNSYISLSNSGVCGIIADTITVTDQNGEGIKYIADYSAGFTDRSLVDKAYVDGITGVTTDITITQSNTTVTVNSSSGADGTIIAATSSTAGVLSSGDKRKLDDLVLLSGVVAESEDLGTFTGTIIPDTSTVKGALQALESAIDASTTGGNYVYTTSTSYTMGGDNNTVYAEASGNNIVINIGGLLSEGDIYYLYTRRDLSFSITLNPISPYQFFYCGSSPSAELISTPITTPNGSGFNTAFMLQRRGNVIFITLLNQT
jgi:hypothetical protein